jgi:integrase
MRGVFKRCGCTEVVDGKRRQLGARCPKLRRSDGTWNPRHGTWTYATALPAKGGKRQQVVRGGFETATDAQRALDTRRAQVVQGVVVNDRLTVGQYLAEWLTAKSDLQASTRRAYGLHIAKYLDPQLGHLRLTELRVAHVTECLAEVTSSDANRQRVRATLRAALTGAVKQGLLGVNPAALVTLPSGKRPKALVWTPQRVSRWKVTGEMPSPVMVWTPEQLGAFLDVAEQDRLYALFHLVAHRGLRRGEACGLAWADVDLDKGRVTVRLQLVQLGWEVYEDTPKSDAGDRTVALDAGTVAVLRAHRRRQLAGRLDGGRRGRTRGRCSPARTAHRCTRPP